MMTQEEARPVILQKFNDEYLPEIGGRENIDEVLEFFPFYGWLHKHYPNLITFPDEGDPYQTVASWIHSAELGEVD